MIVGYVILQIRTVQTAKAHDSSHRTFLAVRRMIFARQIDHRRRAHALLEAALGVPGVRPAPVVDLDEGDQLQEGDRVHAAHDGGVDWKG